MDSSAGAGYYGYRLLLMLLILGVNAFFAAAEAALISVRPSRLKALAAKGFLGAQAALSLLANPERLLSVSQVGLTLASLLLGWLGEQTLFELLKDAFNPLRSLLGQTALGIACFVVAFVIMTYLHVVFGEVVPKNLALNRADRLAILVAPLLLIFYRIAEPFVWVIEKSATAISHLFGARGVTHGGGHSPEELKFIVSSSFKSGHLSEFEEDALHNLIELKGIVVREVMTPRNDIIMVSSDADLDDVLRLISESRYSRLPVFENTRDNIVGLVHVKDVLDFWTARRLSNLRRKGVEKFAIKSIMRKAPVVPETKPLDQALGDMRVQHAHLALVVDEFGTIVGLISMEDVIEQVFGEIEDEFDQPAAPPLEEADVLDVEGTTSIRDLESQHGIALPADLGFETLAGFVMYKLGRIPQTGDSVEAEGRRFLVEEMDFNRVSKVRIERLSNNGE